jgi:PAS domain S-box-containing protein
MENIKYKILLIEDNKIDQLAFKRLVEDEKLPYDCTIAGSVAQATQILAKGQFDVIISDYSLGDGTAFDIFPLVKDTPLVFITGTGDEEIAVRAYKAGACDYLIKDIERNYLKTVPITVENVIRHKKTEDKLRLLSGAIMNTEDAVYITDTENKIIFVNKAFCKTYGYSEDEVLGQYSQILWMNKNSATNTRCVFQMSSSSQIKFYHRRKDGSILPVSLSRAIIKDAAGKNIAVASIAHDITEQVLLEEQLTDLNKKIQKQTGSVLAAANTET